MPKIDTTSIRRDAIEYCLTNDHLNCGAFAEHVLQEVVASPVGREGLTMEEGLYMAILHSSDTEALQIKELAESGQFEE